MVCIAAHTKALRGASLKKIREYPSASPCYSWNASRAVFTLLARIIPNAGICPAIDSARKLSSTSTDLTDSDSRTKATMHKSNMLDSESQRRKVERSELARLRHDLNDGIRMKDFKRGRSAAQRLLAMPVSPEETPTVLSKLLYLISMERDLDQLIEVYRGYRDRSLDENGFSVVIQALASANRSEHAEAVLRDMILAHIEPRQRSFCRVRCPGNVATSIHSLILTPLLLSVSQIVGSYAREGDLNNSMRMLCEMTESLFEPSPV
jgi:pentatricopeptide repeat protein